MRTNLKKESIFFLMVIFCIINIGVFADIEIFNMDGYDPVTGMWIAGDGQGTQSHSKDTTIFHNGAASLKWRYALPVDPNNDWPTIEMTIPESFKNWTGATDVGVWMYFDLTGTKLNWTIEPVLVHPYPTLDTLGNWDSGVTGVPAGTWTQHNWAIGSSLDISFVQYIRFTYHGGDGWAALAKSGNVDIYLDDISVVGIDLPTPPDFILFDMEDGDPVTNTWIGGSAQGTQIHSQSTTIFNGGSASLMWRYQLPGTPMGNYPNIEMTIPDEKVNWTGGTDLNVWMYLDLTGLKTDWTIQPVLCHPFPTITELGNWNTGGAGVPPAMWINHNWSLASLSDISNVTHLRFYYHAGDGWAPLAKAGNVDIYLDDIGVYGASVPTAVKEGNWDLY